MNFCFLRQDRYYICIFCLCICIMYLYLYMQNCIFILVRFGFTLNGEKDALLFISNAAEV